MADFVPPLRLETLKAYAEEIFTPIRRGESVATVWAPMVGRRTRNKFIIGYPQLFANELGDREKHLLVYIEPLELTEESSSGYLSLIIKSIVESYKNQAAKMLAAEEFVGASGTYAELLEKLTQLVKEVASRDLKVVLFLGEFDELQFANSVLYNNLMALWDELGGKLQFIFLLLEDVTAPEVVRKFGELNALLLINVVYVPLLGEEDVEYLIEYFSGQLARKFSPEEATLLKRLCGGHPYLLKSCTRLIALMNGKKMEVGELERMLVSHFEPRSVCQKILDTRSGPEQQILKQIVSGKFEKLPEEANTLVSLGLVKKGKEGSWQTFGQLFASVIQRGKQEAQATPSSGGLSFDEKAGAIFANGVNVEEKFTRQEYEILRFLLTEPEKLRSRDEISQAMWGEQSYDKYSDWAIDQVMSKVRKKLKELGIEKGLATVRGRGYKLVLH